MTGIYGIHNKITDKWYIGQSINIENRFKHHKWGLISGYHFNRHLLHSWQQYGQSAFEFLVIEECEKSVLNDREKHWIKKYNSIKNGYNQCEGGNSTKDRIVTNEMRRAESLARMGKNNPFYGKQHSFEWKQSLSKRQLGHNNPMFGKFGENHPRSRKVRCVETEVVYSSLCEAERQTGIDRNNICSCCNGKLKSAGKFHWEYVFKND